MKLNWKEIKPIISTVDNDRNNFISVIDETGNIILSNAEMRRELKLGNVKEVKKNLTDILHPIHLENFRTAFTESKKNGRTCELELYMKNGHYHPMKWQIKRLSYVNNGLKTFICLGTYLNQSILQNIETGNYNNKEENIFKAFYNSTDDLIWVLNEDSVLIKANQAFLQYFRLDATDLKKKISEILPLAVADALYDKHVKVLQTGIPLELIEHGKLLDDTKVSFQIKLFLCGNLEGKKLVGGFARDITEKKNIEKKLEAANERLINLSKITTDAIWEWNMLTGEIMRNEKLTDLTGYLPETQKGLAWWLSRVHPEDRNRLSDTLTGVTDKGLQSWESEYRFFCADGEYKNILDRGFVIYEKGMPIKMIGSLSDITSQKLLENLLIEEKVRQYKILSESAIRVQEQERSRLGREMHDNVNQILSTIKLFLGMLNPTSPSDEDIKKKTIEYTLLAIEEIRKLSKEMVAPQLDGGSLADHIKNLITDVELSTEINVKFTYDNENDLLSPGKKLALFRIAQEQIKNVLKYSSATDLEILLYCKNELTHLSIRDNGKGFDIKKTSAGIGLANIRERAKFYGGKTEILSAIGEGCQLNVSIPLTD